MNRFSTESYQRLLDKLKTDLGNLILKGLSDNAVQEIQLNADGKLFFHQNGQNILQGILPTHQGYAIIYGIAGLNHKVVTEHNSCLEAELPYHAEFHGERFTAQIPPTTKGPSFALRKKSTNIWTLQDYLASQRLTQEQYTKIQELIAKRCNIIVCGGPNSGKTTVTNALIAEMTHQFPKQRILILEDTPELQCLTENHQALFTSENITMTRLLKQVMRLSPERILVGEVRGKEALDLLKAWNTGCPGGIATLHANGPVEALQRLQDLTLEAGLISPPLSLIKHTVDAVVFVTEKQGKKGCIQTIQPFGEIS